MKVKVFTQTRRGDRFVIRVSQSRWLPFELFKNIGKTPKSSVPVLSAQKPWFSQGFSRFWPVPLAVCSAHAGSVHGGSRRCISRRAAQIESFFESRESPKHWGFECPLSGTD